MVVVSAQEHKRLAMRKKLKRLNVILSHVLHSGQSGVNALLNVVVEPELDQEKLATQQNSKTRSVTKTLVCNGPTLTQWDKYPILKVDPSSMIILNSWPSLS